MITSDLPAPIKHTFLLAPSVWTPGMYAQMLIGQGKDVGCSHHSRLKLAFNLQCPITFPFSFVPREGNELSSMPCLFSPCLLSSMNAPIRILLAMGSAVNAVEIRKLNVRHRRISVISVPQWSSSYSLPDWKPHALETTIFAAFRNTDEQ